ncbi:MAG: ATP-dependent nuclease [Ginsengibacter sp.]
MQSLLIRNYKSFDDEGCAITSFKDINIIIGKNNTGKSSIIDVIQFLIVKNSNFFKNLRDGKTPKLIFEDKITPELITKAFPAGRGGGELASYASHQAYGMQFVDRIIQYEMNDTQPIFLNVKGSDVLSETAIGYFRSYVQKISNIFDNKSFLHLTAERDIQPEVSDSQIKILPNGAGATNFIQQIINRSDLNSSLVEKELLEELNRITNPDIHFSRILVQQIESSYWEIYFENNEGGRIPLSKMGSGIKTILLVLLLILIKPKIDKKPISSYIFALEELENNLHPSQQRRLYYYLYQFSKTNNCVFFFTTHSNIVIDLYNKLENTQIIHVTKRDDRTSITSISQYSELNVILDDLDIKASDILQSNSILWVEGPSDRTYLNKWIKIVDQSLVEGYHYSIMFYGGRLLSNLSLDYDNLQEELIALIKLNRNCYILMDRDGKTLRPKLNETKKRIAMELGKDRVWITKGREIENYLSNRTLNNWLKKNYEFRENTHNSINEKLEITLDNLQLSKQIKYNLNKNKYAHEIINHIERDDLNVLDLKLKIEHIVDLIKRWNKE